MADKKIQDFGEKIGGARKDVWSARGLALDDLMGMNEAERLKYANKANVWPTPDWRKAMAEGEPQVILYWKNEMRKAFPPKPLISVVLKDDPDAIKKTQEAYVDFCGKYRDAVMAVQTGTDIQHFTENFLVKEGYVTVQQNQYTGSRNYTATEKSVHCVSSDMLRMGSLRELDIRKLAVLAKNKLFAVPKDQEIYQAIKNNLEPFQVDGKNIFAEDLPQGGLRITVGNSWSKMFFHDYDTKMKAAEIEQGKWLIVDIAHHRLVGCNIESKDRCEQIIEEVAQKSQEQGNAEKENGKGSGRKKSFAFRTLATYERNGPDYLHGIHAGEKEFLQNLGFRACEFGNWVSDAERQKHLDLAFESLGDLAAVLNINKKDVSLDGQLALAFGSRGRGGASAGSAHYEPMRKVINLTKMSGAGCLAHEWAHALDDSLGQRFGLPTGKLLTENINSRSVKDKVPPALKEIVSMMKYKNVTPSLEQAEQRRADTIQTTEKNVSRWAKSVQPSRMTDEQREKWDSLVAGLTNGTEKLQGGEYFSFGRQKDSGATFAPIEALSAYRKELTGHGIPKDMKYSIVCAIRGYQDAKEKPVSAYQQPQQIQTDFMAGSKKFDAIFSKAGHGYWSSEPEMFARAFDCYIEDKLKAQGLESPYLTSHASAFICPDGQGGVIRAIPAGEERKALDEKFDELISQIKERDIFHEQEKEPEEPEKMEAKVRDAFRDDDLERYVKSQQLSFDDFAL